MMKQYLTKRNFTIGAVAFVIIISSVLIYIFSNLRKPDEITYSITELAEFGTGGDTHDIEVHYGIAFISDMDADQLVILNVSDPQNPHLISTYQADDNHGLAIVAKSPTDMICYLACDVREWISSKCRIPPFRFCFQNMIRHQQLMN